MSHPLAIYTALFFAIIFLTVSIWSSKIQDASGEGLALLILQATFCLKLAIDDYVHFQRLAPAPGSSETAVEKAARRRKTARSLWFSLSMYLLLAASIACAASTWVRTAEVLFAGMMAVGLAWLLSNSPTDDKDKRRHFAWICINLGFIAVLLTDVFAFPAGSGDCSVLLIGGLAFGVVLDAIVLGTITRLADLE